jgi:glycosyltransferase involved in cell wall biosynthesis
MKILIVCSGNSGNISSFVKEQAEAIAALSNEVIIYEIIGKGIIGYMGNISHLKKKIKEYSPDLIHAHYGLSGLVSCFQKIVPVIITFHGSDAYLFYVKLLSKIAAHLSIYNIFVGNKIKNKIKGHKNNSVIPCGVNLDKFYPIDQKKSIKKTNLNPNKINILFSSSFDNSVKNYKLAKVAIALLNKDIEIIELINKSRDEVNLLLNSCDLLLLTSTSEGSPQIIKEAMACNCPIVTTDVGDISEIIGNTNGCFVTSFNPSDVAYNINKAIEFVERTNGRENIFHYDNNVIVKDIISIYKTVLNKK